MKQLRDILKKGLEYTLIVAFIILTLDVLWGVFSRYVLGAQSRWTEELAIYLLIWVSLLGASLTYEEHGHLGVDYLVGKLDPAARRIAAITAELCVLGFAVFGLVIGGWILVERTLSSGQVSPAMEVKVGYLYAAAPISGVFFVIFAVEHLMELFAGRVDFINEEEN